MLMITLATIYQGKKLILQYKKKDAYLFSQAHLHHDLTGELIKPCVGRVSDLMTNPSPESSSKVASKKGNKGKNLNPPPLPYPQQDNDTVGP